MASSMVSDGRDPDSPPAGFRVPFWVLAVLLGLVLIGAWATTRSNDCESLPANQLRIGGVTYMMSMEPPTLTEADLGSTVGTIREGLPREAERCGQYTLRDGQGTPPVGTDVRLIVGIDQSVSVAAVVGFQVMKFDAVDAESQQEPA
jgi:hypothetical protein